MKKLGAILLGLSLLLVVPTVNAARPADFCEKRPNHPKCVVSPTPTPVSTPTPIPTPTPTPNPTPTPTPTPTAPAVTTAYTGFTQPLYFMEVNGYKYVVQRQGLIRVINSAGTVSTFLDLTSKITSGGSEQGVLGLEFHPNFPTTGRIFVNYTNTSGNTVVSEFTATNTSANISTENILLTFTQPFANHNGGHLEFGSDGFLYIASGDGGSAGDPNNNAQNSASLLGKILRLNVDTEAVSVWAKGLRNPWRFSFDSITMYIGDVGQGSWEEIDRATTSGLNFGWRVMEGNHCYNATTCSTTGFTAPIHEYAHGTGDCSITGGYVYRGTKFPSLVGKYIYGDFCSGKIWTLSGTTNTLLFDTSFQISSFGVDEEKEVYIIGYNTGTIYKIN